MSVLRAGPANRAAVSDASLCPCPYPFPPLALSLFPLFPLFRRPPSTRRQGVRIVIDLECTTCRTNENQRSPGVNRYTTEKNRRCVQRQRRGLLEARRERALSDGGPSRVPARSRARRRRGGRHRAPSPLMGVVGWVVGGTPEAGLHTALAPPAMIPSDLPTLCWTSLSLLFFCVCVCRNTTARLELKKHCPNCNCHTVHKEIK